MGIIKKPTIINYPYPKAKGKGFSRGKILARVKVKETFKDWGDYMRFLDWIEFSDGHKEMRFAQFYRKSGGTNSDWVYGQGAGHMKLNTFYSLLKKAKSNPNFEGIFDKIKIIG